MKSSESFDDSHAITIPNAVEGGSSRVLRPGDVIGGSYKLKTLLGRGGMGYVFCAEHIALGLDYALKMLAPEQLNDVSRRRFEVEGRAIANLDHVNIVKVHNMGLDSGDCPFYVMDLLSGKSLADCIADGIEFPLEALVDIFIQIAEGLGYAHSKGIVHRDVKPSNIILLKERQRWRVKIVDFGIAKLLPSADLHSQSQTATGEVFGSPYYMSPEQCMGGKIDEASDMYSLGCTLYETLIGTPPFRGENPMQTVMMHQNAEVPSVTASPRGAKCPPSVDKLLSKMMAKRSADRYQSMRQLVHDLERLLQGKAVGGAVSSAASVSGAANDEDTGDGATEKSSISRMALVLSCVILLVAVGAVLGLQHAGFFAQHAGANGTAAGGSLVTGHEAVAPQIHKQQIEELETGSSDTGLMSPGARATGYKEVDGYIDSVFKAPHVVVLTREKEALRLWKMIVSECQPIVSHKVMVKGVMMREFVFPEKSIANIVYESKDGVTSYDAVGKKQLPNRPLGLAVGYTNWHYAFSLPEVLAKVGKDEFVSLGIAGQNDRAEISREKGLRAESEGAEMMLKYACKWNYLHRLMLSKIFMDDSLVRAINTLPHLDFLEIYHCTLNSKLFLQQPYLLKVHTLLLSDYKDLKPLLQKLKQSKNLTGLKLFNADISVEDLQTLDSYPTLFSLQLSERNYQQLIPQLTKMTKLKNLLLSGGKMTHPQIHALTSMPNLDHLLLSDETYGAVEEREYLKNNEPKVTLCPFE